TLRLCIVWKDRSVGLLEFSAAFITSTHVQAVTSIRIRTLKLLKSSVPRGRNPSCADPGRPRLSTGCYGTLEPGVPTTKDLPRQMSPDSGPFPTTSPPESNPLRRLLTLAL